VVIVAGRMMWGLGRGDLDVTAHVVGVCGLAGLEGRVEPVSGNGHVGVDEREDFAAGVAGGVGGLDLGLVTQREAAVVVRTDDLGAQLLSSGVRSVEPLSTTTTRYSRSVDWASSDSRVVRTPSGSS
jgi:hypothetical protein